MSEGRSRVGVLDAVAVGLCAIGLLAIWAFQLLVVPRYAAMFVNFIDALPTMTRLVLQPIVASVASAVVLGLLGAGLYSRVANRRERGAALMLLAAVVPFVTVAFMFYAAVHKPMEMSCFIEEDSSIRFQRWCPQPAANRAPHRGATVRTPLTLAASARTGEHTSAR